MERTFKNLLGNPSEITDKLIKKIINTQLNIRLKHFTVEKIDTVQTKVKNKNAAGLNEIQPENMEDKKIWHHTFSII